MTSQLHRFVRVMSAVFLVTLGAVLGVVAPAHAGLVIGATLEKLVNGEIADVAPGPQVPVGSTVTFTYRVTSAAFIPDDILIHSIVVEDDNGTPGDLGDDFNPTFTGGDAGVLGRLENGETWTYSATRLALLGGNENIASVNGSFTVFSTGLTFSLSPEFDRGHYTGIAPVGVPEPATLALLGAGLFALGYFRRGRS